MGSQSTPPKFLGGVGGGRLTSHSRHISINTRKSPKIVFYKPHDEWRLIALIVAGFIQILRAATPYMAFLLPVLQELVGVSWIFTETTRMFRRCFGGLVIFCMCVFFLYFFCVHLYGPFVCIKMYICQYTHQNSLGCPFFCWEGSNIKWKLSSTGQYRPLVQLGWDLVRWNRGGFCELDSHSRKEIDEKIPRSTCKNKEVVSVVLVKWFLNDIQIQFSSWNKSCFNKKHFSMID